MENGHEGDTENNHRQWQAKIVLHETHAICISLAWTRQKSNGTGLRAHDAQQYEIPGHAAVAEKISLQVFGSVTFIQSIRNDAHKRNDEHYPIL